MRPETAIVEIHGKYKIHTEHYRNPAANKTIILVNGSLATTAFFAQTVRSLQPRFNVLLYDQPYAGQPKAHNRHDRPIRREDEAEILLESIEHFRANHLLSFSWRDTRQALLGFLQPAAVSAMATSAPLLDGRRYPLVDHRAVQRIAS